MTRPFLGDPMLETPLLPCKNAAQLLRLLSGDWFTLESEPPESLREALGALVSAGFIQFRFSVEVSDLEPGMRRLHFQVVTSGHFEPLLLPAQKEAARALLPQGRAFNLQSRLSAIRRTTRGLEYLNSGCDPALVALQPPLIRPGDFHWECSPPVLPASAEAAVILGNPQVNPSVAPKTLEERESKFIVEYLGLKLDVGRRQVTTAGVADTAELEPVQTAVLQRCLESGETWVDQHDNEDLLSEVKSRSGRTYESADPFLAARIMSKLRQVLALFGRTIKNDRNGGYRIEKTAAPQPPRKKKARHR